MTSFSFLLLSTCLALALQSATCFVVAPLRSLVRSNSVEMPMFRRNNAVNKPSEPSRGKAVEITEITKMDDFLQFLAKDDRLCVVKFHASWCKSCQKFGVKFRHLGQEIADVYDGQELVQEGKVRLASIEFGANTSLCRALGIKRLPYVHIYKNPVGRIDDFSCGPSKFPMLEEKLHKYMAMSNEALQFEKYMDKGGALGDVIVSELKAINDEQQQQQQQVLARNGLEMTNTTRGGAP